jgi:hypothetical protein
MNETKKAVAGTCIALLAILGCVAAEQEAGAEGSVVAGERACC